MIHSMNKAPAIVWRNDDGFLVAVVGTWEIGVAFLNDNVNVWESGFIGREDEPFETEAEAKSWIESMWQEFWTKIHETPYEGEDGS